MALRGNFITSGGQRAPFNVDGPAAEVEVVRDLDGRVLVRVYDRESNYGIEGRGRLVQDFELTGPTGSVKVILEEHK